MRYAVKRLIDPLFDGTAFDADVRAKYPALESWSYRYDDGELTLDFGAGDVSDTGQLLLDAGGISIERLEP